MGLDELHLRVLATSSEDKTEKRNAQKGSLEWLRAAIHHLLTSHTSAEAAAEKPSLGPCRKFLRFF